MVGDPTPPAREGPPGLAAEQLEEARSQLAVLVGLADRLSAAGNDRESLEALGRETRQVLESLAAYPFPAAARFAAGMEATVKEWRARPDEVEVDRGSLAHWFVRQLADMLGIEPPAGVSPLPSGRPVAAPVARPLPPPAADVPRPPPPPPSVPERARPPVSSSGPPTPQPATPAPGGLPWVVPPGAPSPRAATAAVPPTDAAKLPPATAASAADTAAPVAGERAGAPQVIYVEDDAALAELLEYGLRLQGYRFQAFHNGREALQALLALDVQGTHPLLLLDTDLPGLDGYSVLDVLQRERPGTYRVVFTTARDTEEEQLRGLEAGALDYLVKPIGLRVILEKIKRWVAR